eukprot:scaffold81924_cov54-Attheya_sp.AAC.1
MSGYLKLREIHLLYWATCGSVPGRGGRSGRAHRCHTPILGSAIFNFVLRLLSDKIPLLRLKST